MEVEDVLRLKTQLEPRQVKQASRRARGGIVCSRKTSSTDHVRVFIAVRRLLRNQDLSARFTDSFAEAIEDETMLRKIGSPISCQARVFRGRENRRSVDALVHLSKWKGTLQPPRPVA